MRVLRFALGLDPLRFEAMDLTNTVVNRKLDNAAFGKDETRPKQAILTCKRDVFNGSSVRFI
jgi:hypothetical protein